LLARGSGRMRAAGRLLSGVWNGLLDTPWEEQGVGPSEAPPSGLGRVLAEASDLSLDETRLLQRADLLWQHVYLAWDLLCRARVPSLHGHPGRLPSWVRCPVREEALSSAQRCLRREIVGLCRRGRPKALAALLERARREVGEAGLCLVLHSSSGRLLVPLLVEIAQFSVPPPQWKCKSVEWDCKAMAFACLWDSDFGPDEGLTDCPRRAFLGRARPDPSLVRTGLEVALLSSGDGVWEGLRETCDTGVRAFQAQVGQCVEVLSGLTDWRYHDMLGQCALQAAVRSGNLGVAHALLRRGCDPDAREGGPLGVLTVQLRHWLARGGKGRSKMDWITCLLEKVMRRVGRLGTEWSWSQLFASEPWALGTPTVAELDLTRYLEGGDLCGTCQSVPWTAVSWFSGESEDPSGDSTLPAVAQTGFVGSRSFLHVGCRGVRGLGPRAVGPRPLEEAAGRRDAAMVHLLARHGASVCVCCLRLAMGRSSLFAPAHVKSLSGGAVLARRASAVEQVVEQVHEKLELKRVEAWRMGDVDAVAALNRTPVCETALKGILLREAATWRDDSVCLAAVRGARRHMAWIARERLIVWRRSLQPRGGGAT
jgi:hypothetical protein